MKQVIIVDASLNLPVGKLAAQVAHAAVGAYLEADRAAQQAWVSAGMPKVVLKVGAETPLRDLHAQARRHSIPAKLVEDAGRTVIAAGTLTCLGLGPAEAAAIDVLTGDLELL